MADNIRIAMDKIHVESDGKIVIHDPALAAAIEEAKNTVSAAGENPNGPDGFLDWKCSSNNVGCL